MIIISTTTLAEAEAMTGHMRQAPPELRWRVYLDGHAHSEHPLARPVMTLPGDPEREMAARLTQLLARQAGTCGLTFRQLAVHLRVTDETALAWLELDEAAGLVRRQGDHWVWCGPEVSA